MFLMSYRQMATQKPFSVTANESNTAKAHQLGANREKPGPERETAVEVESFYDFSSPETGTFKGRPCIQNESVPINN